MSNNPKDIYKGDECMGFEKFSVEVLQIRGRSYDIGVQIGEKMKNHPIVITFEEMAKQVINIKNMKAIYEDFAPHLLDELEGLSEGLKLPFHRAAAILSGYDMPKVEAMGCSAVITKDYYVRNYDFSPRFYDHLFSFIQPEECHASAGYNLQLIGRHDGVNSKGLVVGLHFVSNDSYKEGISAWTAIRMVLDSCASTDEAIVMLKEIPHAACYNFSIGDKGGDIAVVEASPDKVAIRRGDHYLACVNHFLINELKEKNRKHIEHSIRRSAYIAYLEEQSLTAYQMFNEFSNRQSPLFFTEYGDLFGTMHTFAYSFTNARLQTKIAQGIRGIDVNFDEWVNGKNIEYADLKGKIEFDAKSKP